MKAALELLACSLLAGAAFIVLVTAVAYVFLTWLLWSSWHRRENAWRDGR